MKTIVFGAGTDLGVHVNGASFGPETLINNINDLETKCILLKQDDKYIKSTDKNDKRKNEDEIEKYNSNLYNTIVEKTKDDCFPIMLGGDHSAAIASALASCKRNDNIGIIWIDAHTDYNTFETTVTGNIHGLPLAAIDGYKCEELYKYHDGKNISPKNTVVVGARSIDELEKLNVKDAGITVFTTEDIKEMGIQKVMDEAFRIANEGTNGIHVSYDLDVIDPHVAPGVSVPEIDGISEEEALNINEYLINHIDVIKSFDLVEFNPLRDKDDKTLNIALKILKPIIKKINNK